MDQVNNAVNFFDSSVNDAMFYVKKNEYFSTALILFLIVYAGVAAPKLPVRIARLFDNTLFKVLLLFLIAYSSRNNPTVSIVAAVGLMVSLHTLNRIKLFGDSSNSGLMHSEEMAAKSIGFNVVPQEYEAVLNEEALSELSASMPAPVTSESAVEQEGRPNGMAFGQAGCANFMPPSQYLGQGNDISGYSGEEIGGYY